MKRTTQYIWSALIATAYGAVMISCSESTPPDASGTYFGPVTPMAGGSGRSYVILDGGGSPTELGVSISESALTGLPATASEYVFALPEQASGTPFKNAVINWQPQGHPPPMVYTVPHFDVHFYTITESVRAAIVLGDSTLAARMIRQPPAAFIPAGYVTGMAMAQMGLHWNDPSAPERHGEPFTKTFIYGSYDGAFIFAEPMVAKSYLETKPARVVTPVMLPSQYATRGYQPTSYAVAWDDGTKEYHVALFGLVSR